MILTTCAFATWLAFAFASEAFIESFGVPSASMARHYALVIPTWVFAACVYAFAAYECLNLMSVPSDFNARFSGVYPDKADYVVSDDDVRRGLEESGRTSEIPLFRDVLAREATARTFNARVRADLIRQCNARVA